jgi:general secretion pathway protein B
MSYILDALRRADAERSRGAVPGLHAHNIPADGEPAARNYRPLIWAAGGAGALLVAVVVVLVVAPWRPAPGPDAGVARAPVAPAPELTPPGRDNLPTLAQGETPPTRPDGLAPAALPVEPPMGRGPAGARPAPYPPPAFDATLAERAAAGRVATLVPRAAAASAAAATSKPPIAQAPVEHYGPPAATASAATRAAAVQNINDLAPALRAQLPRLTVGGAIYSETPSARMVILNGQVWHEGDKPAADTVLEQIRLKSAVLNFRGQRYEVSY